MKTSDDVDYASICVSYQIYRAITLQIIACIVSHGYICIKTISYLPREISRTEQPDEALDIFWQRIK